MPKPAEKPIHLLTMSKALETANLAAADLAIHINTISSLLRGGVTATEAHDLGKALEAGLQKFRAVFWPDNEG